MDVAVIGCGAVGDACTRKLLRLARIVWMIDPYKEGLEGRAQDISIGSDYGRAVVGDYTDISQCEYVVITAGRGQKPGEDRLNLVYDNAKITQNIVKEVAKHAPDCFMVIIGNPVDVMTSVAVQVAIRQGFPRNKIFGTGTMLEKIRWIHQIVEVTNCARNQVQVYPCGEHGRGTVFPENLVRISGIPIQTYCQALGIEYSMEKAKSIHEKVVNEAYYIIKTVGYTNEGIGLVSAEAVRRTCHPWWATLQVCTDLDDNDPFIVSRSHIINQDGIKNYIDLPLNEEDKEQLIDINSKIVEIRDKALANLGL